MKDKKGSISVSSILNLSSTPKKDPSKARFFKIKTHLKEYTLEASSDEDKKKWIDILSNVKSKSSCIKTETRIEDLQRDNIREDISKYPRKKSVKLCLRVNREALKLIKESSELKPKDPLKEQIKLHLRENAEAFKLIKESSQRKNMQNWHVLSTGGLCIRQKASIDAQDIGILPYGDIVEGIEKNGWVQHHQGWSLISNQTNTFLQIEKQWLVLSTDGLRIRQNASLGAKEIGILPEGSIIDGIERNGWVRHHQGWSLISNKTKTFLQLEKIKKTEFRCF